MNVNSLNLKKFVLRSLKIIGIFLLAIFILLLIARYWALFNGFAYSCSKIQEGMTVEQAEDIMKKYINNESYFFLEKGDVIGWGRSDYECGAKIKDGKLFDVQKGFNHASF